LVGGDGLDIELFLSMDAFVKAFHPEKLLLIGGDGLDVELFLTMDTKQWLP